MKRNIEKVIFFLCLSLVIAACGSKENKEGGHDHDHGEHEEEHADEVHLSQQQFTSLKMKVDTLKVRNMGEFVESNGQLEVPPQNEATVTALFGANIQTIKVIEGDKVKKGQVLAYLSHPDLIDIQTEYSSNWNQLQYLSSDYERQKKLYDEKVGSGKEFQKIKSEYLGMKSKVRGSEAQLEMMGLNTEKIRQGEVFSNIAVKSPIDGNIKSVEIKIGQYVQPQTDMFEIVNIEHIHLDLMVFEKDMHKVKEGQNIRFSIPSNPNEELTAKIYSVGKSFEQNPKAVHIHAEIENKKGYLIPGMYINAQIETSNAESIAVPESAVVKEGDKFFIFTAEKEKGSDIKEWGFKPIEVSVGTQDRGWIEIKLLSPLKSNVQIAWNNAYYLMAELKKGEAEHTH
ncbi:efflux RND transporter periplasmic adaptor subunit [Wandonia haliotis]|uniref:Efflux RND transporter periplasmic adaptor subunit n=1 Tax=Wandonia haliotis TaxID=574963 RepID=A0ABN1MQP7_9FLAO